MFFPNDLITNTTLKNVWRAAHNQEANTDDVNIPTACVSISSLIDDYSNKRLRHLSLRTASTLFHGTVKTYKQKSDKLSKDAFDLAYEMEFGKPNVYATGYTSDEPDSSSDEGTRERKSDDEGGGEGTSNMGITTGAHRSKVMKMSTGVQTNNLTKGFNNDLPLASISIYAAGSRRFSKTYWTNVSPHIMED